MELEHPAVKNFSPTWEGIKHVAYKALKWAVWGAVIAGVFVAAPAMGIKAGATFIKWISMGYLGGGTAATDLAVWGLSHGALAGAVLGGLSGISGMEKAIEESRQDKIANYNQALIAHELQSSLKKPRNIGLSGGISPEIGFGKGQERGAVRIN